MRATTRPARPLGLPARLPATLAGLALLLAGCPREEVTRYRLAKAPAGAPAAAGEAPEAPAAPPPGMAGDVPAPPPPGAGAVLRWTLPKGWTEAKAGGMRYATLKPPVAGKIDVSVTFLPGAAGGELANVNRWRGQIGLPAFDEPSRAAARKALRSKAGTVSLYDFTAGGDKPSRMIAGLLTGPDGNTWFVKMVGDPKPVEAARPDFTKLVEALRFDESK